MVNPEYVAIWDSKLVLLLVVPSFSRPLLQLHWQMCGKLSAEQRQIMLQHQ